MPLTTPRTLLRRLVEDEAGATSIEYALIGTVVSIGIIVALKAFADAENELFTYIRTTVVGALGGGS